MAGPGSLTVSIPLANPDASLGGTAALTKTGSGLMTLSGANTYSGTTTVSAGTLALTGNGGSVGTLQNSAIVVGAAGELDLAR